MNPFQHEPDLTNVIFLDNDPEFQAWMRLQPQWVWQQSLFNRYKLFRQFMNELKEILDEVL